MVWGLITCAHGIQKEEEFPDSCTDIEGIKGLLQALELRKSGNKLQDVVLQVLHV